MGLILQPAPAKPGEGTVYKVGAYPLYTAELAEGEGKELVMGYCSICHSVTYITMQPPLANWKPTMDKMLKTYGGEKFILRTWPRRSSPTSRPTTPRRPARNEPGRLPPPGPGTGLPKPQVGELLLVAGHGAWGTGTPAKTPTGRFWWRGLPPTRRPRGQGSPSPMGP